MNPVLVGIIGFAVLFAFMALGLPIGIGMAMVGFAGIWYLLSSSAAIIKMAVISFEVVANWDLAVLPLFLFMAHIVFSSGLGTDLYNLASKWLGHQRGGLAMTTIGTSAGFSAVSASSLATAVTMGLVALPEMKKYGYHPALATGSVTAGGTMGSLIPPSAALITYGIISQTSIGRLFIGGIFPGLIEAGLYMLAIYLVCLWRPDWGPRGPRYAIKEKIKAFSTCWEVILLVILILGGIIFGWFTPTEGGAMGAVGAVIFSMLRRRLNYNKLKNALEETMKTTGMLYGILIGASLFKYFMAVTNIPFELAEFVTRMSLAPLGVLILVLLVYFILGCFMDTLAMILLTVPIFLPMLKGLGFDPVWFGILVTVMAEIGLITPPIGLNVYAISGVVPDVPMSTIFKGVMPFFTADIIRVVIYVAFPQVVLFLPSVVIG